MSEQRIPDRIYLAAGYLLGNQICLPVYGVPLKCEPTIEYVPADTCVQIPAEVLDHIGTILATHHAFPGSEAYDELEEWYISLGRTLEAK